MEMKEINLTKWFALGLGGLFGLSHIIMIGMLATRSKQPQIKLPEVGQYSSYRIMSGEDGYSVEYRANDPKTMFITKDITRKGGFLNLQNNTTKVQEEYVMDGSTNQGGPVSNHRSWIDPSALGKGEKKISAKTLECIKATGGGEQTGRLVGGSVGAAAGSGLASVPFVGWVLAGAATMMGMEQGADIGGDMAQGLSKHCIEE
tara:strand:- start:77 stop:685 length:609 start_codon:yes stop_codon:yes gene_type:complete